MMSEWEDSAIAVRWQEHRQEIEAVLCDAFIRCAIDNRGLLTSSRRGPEVASQLYELALNFILGKSETIEIAAVTTQLAEKGMAVTTGAAMMRALGKIAWLQSPDALQDMKLVSRAKLHEFQLLFLETLASAREMVHQRSQENSQLALQRALHTQLNQQQRLRRAQEQRNLHLNNILQLNARLARLTNETDLLNEAVSGICQALELADVSIYERQIPEGRWLIRTTTASGIQPDQTIAPHVVDLLNVALSGDGEIISRHRTKNDRQRLSLILILYVGKKTIGAVLANSNELAEGQEEFPILLRTFTQNLAALWRNLALFTQTRQRARELEILYGRYVDSIWSEETAALRASYISDRLHLERKVTSPPLPESGQVMPLSLGDRPFGHVSLPHEVNLETEQAEFVQALIREMGNALHNAHLLQTTRSYSNQLNVAAEVSRAATTVLDRDLLIKEVVELIRARFGFYYVGLFLADEQGKTAILQAGTGEAGRLQVERGHNHIIGGKSMIGMAIATGRARVEQDVSQAETFSFNPLLPNTRSELALPLRTRSHVIGAFTVQSVEVGAFNSQTILVLQSLADQLAIAIENASLFAQTQLNLSETSRLYQASRQISEASHEVDIYQTLVDFASQSGLVDAAHVITFDPTAPDYLTSPVLWGRIDIPAVIEDRFLRDKFEFSEQLAQNRLILIENNEAEAELEPYTHRLFQSSKIKTTALIPIHTENEWLGTLALHRSEARPFGERELQPFLTLADQAAVILANQRLLHQTESLYRIGRALNQAIVREDALSIAVREVARYMGVAQCRIVLYEKRSGAGTVVAEYVHTGLVGSVQIPMLGDYTYEYLSQQRQPLILEEDASHLPAETLRHHLHQFGARVSLLIPAASQQELIGFMALDSLYGKRPFTQTNIIFAQTVVDHLTTQIENIKLLDEALDRAQELITLNQIQSNISGVLDLEILARVIYDQVGRLLDNTLFILARYEPVTGLYKPILIMHEGESLEVEPRTLAPDEALYHFLYQGAPVIADHATPLMRQEKIPSLEDGLQSSLWIPLQQEGAPAGLISVHSNEVHAYSENDMQLLRNIATQTSLAMANAELFSRTQANVIELRQLDQLKNQFLANMSHELRTPLNSIIGFSRVILKGIDGPLTKEQEEDLTSIYSNGQHLLMLINEILDMAKIEAGKMTLTFEMVNLEEAAQAVLTSSRSLINQDVELVWNIGPDLPLIEADPVRVRQMLLNLLSNAAKYTHQGSIRLEISRENKDRVHVAIHDSGIGIAPEDYDKVFTAFEQGDSSTTRSAGGTGLGLPITQWLVNMHQGKIWFESEVGKGTSFHILLPTSQKNNRPPETLLNNPSVALPTLN